MSEEKIVNFVEKMLKSSRQNRNSDKWLLINTLKAMGFQIDINIDEIADMPNFDSILRAGRKLRADNSELKGSDEVEDVRQEKQEEYRLRYSNPVNKTLQNMRYGN